MEHHLNGTAAGVTATTHMLATTPGVTPHESLPFPAPNDYHECRRLLQGRRRLFVSKLERNDIDEEKLRLMISTGSVSSDRGRNREQVARLQHRDYHKWHQFRHDMGKRNNNGIGEATPTGASMLPQMLAPLLVPEQNGSRRRKKATGTTAALADDDDSSSSSGLLRDLAPKPWVPDVGHLSGTNTTRMRL
jgi:hypothetical protein